MTRWRQLTRGSADRPHDGGYVAVLTALLLMVFMGFAAFAVDVGHWYLVGQQEQRAADAAAMAGVTYLPGNPSTAFATAQNYSTVNGFQNGGITVVTPSVDSQPTRLKVTVSQTVTNFFGSFMGAGTTKVARSAIADYAGPVPLGSPCNEFGADPATDINGHQSTNCNGTGAFWANVGSMGATKSFGDAFQDNACGSAVDGCSGSNSGPNTDFDPNGYFYTVTVTQPVANLTIEAFDPALIDVGDLCDANNLIAAKLLPAAKTAVTDPLTRYANGASSAYCTGDIRYGGTGDVATQFTVRSPGPNPWNPLSFPKIGGACTQTFGGYSGDLKVALDKTTQTYVNHPDVAANFRQWKTLCTIPNAQPGTYLVQVNTNGLGKDAASGHNRFSLRAYGGSSADNDSLAVAGYNKMAMYGNTPNGTSSFFLAKVPSGAKGQTFNVNLFDIGDGATGGSTVTVLPPTETVPNTFSNCTGVGVQNGALSNCQINVSSSFNGKWQTISVPIPATYSCADASPTGCWVRLKFFYGNGSNPTDTTSWTASIVGDPVRLVQ